MEAKNTPQQSDPITADQANEVVALLDEGGWTHRRIAAHAGVPRWLVDEIASCADWSWLLDEDRSRDSVGNVA